MNLLNIILSTIYFHISNAGFSAYQQPISEAKPNQIREDFENIFPDLNIEAIKAEKIALEYIQMIDKLEQELSDNKLMPLRGSEEYMHQNLFGTNSETLNISRIGLIGLKIANQLSIKFNLTQNERKFSLFDLSQTSLKNLCPKEPECFPTKYRSADGSCNNQMYKSWGRAHSTFNRLLSPEYADSFDSPRVASDGSQLPSARKVSTLLTKHSNIAHPKFTALTMQFGQFLDHDLIRTAITRTKDNKAIKCCGKQFDDNPNLLHPACLPIKIPPNDKFYRKFNKTCLDFVRSAVGLRQNCLLGPREQINQLSSYIDGSMIYGNSLKESISLRSLNGGKLNTSIVCKQEFLPFMINDSDCGIPQKLKLKCFAAGDIRVDEQLTLVVMHTVWLKEHNRIADALHQLNPEWDDEVLYQETRRIVIAEIQHIVFNEFLRILIGRQTMIKYRLSLETKGYSYKYSPATDTSILSAFATAAYRFHNLVPGVIDLKKLNNKASKRIQLRETFFDPSVIYKFGAYDQLINGLSSQPIKKADNSFSTDLQNHLFQSKGEFSGLDLISININRGRDHGIPNYNKWRVFCGLPRIQSFKQLECEFQYSWVARKMSLIYKSVDDIDLYIAAISEKLLKGAIVGPTFACIIGEQFLRLKEGDRFWYENGELETSFSLKQLTEIRKSTLARVLCDNSKVHVMQPLAMVKAFMWNPKVSCNSSDIPRLDLSPWKTNIDSKEHKQNLI